MIEGYPVMVWETPTNSDPLWEILWVITIYHRSQPPPITCYRYDPAILSTAVNSKALNQLNQWLITMLDHAHCLQWLFINAESTLRHCLPAAFLFALATTLGNLVRALSVGLGALRALHQPDCIAWISMKNRPWGVRPWLITIINGWRQLQWRCGWWHWWQLLPMLIKFLENNNGWLWFYPQPFWSENHVGLGKAPISRWW